MFPSSFSVDTFEIDCHTPQSGVAAIESSLIAIKIDTIN
jgi:hypothetical protein